MTANLGLSQWASTDSVVREDFNADNALIDAAIAALPRIETGSYAGTGTSGSGAANTLSFDFKPKVLIIVSDNLSDHFFSIVINTLSLMRIEGVSNIYSNTVTWGDDSVTWYNGSNGGVGNAKYQLNVSGTSYSYFAIG